MQILLTLVLALSVKQDQAQLRAGCAEDSTVVRMLAAGTPLEMRYVMAGETAPCYKVKATVGTWTYEGYLFGPAIEGLEDFDKNRRKAESAGANAAIQAARSSQNLAELSRGSEPLDAAASIRAGSRVLIARAQDFIEANQPAKALDLLEPELKKHKDGGLLALAGYAAWRSDQAKTALEYWKESLAMSPNPQLEALYKRVEREHANDQSGEKLFGVRVVLRYDPGIVPVETARQMLTIVDATYARVSAQLGCTTDQRIVTIVQSRDAYMKATNAAEWSGGQYDGRIRIPVQAGQTMTADSERTLAHETTHACLSILGQWPAWVQEGFAQKLSGDHLPPAMQARLKEMAQQKQLPRLQDLKQDWSRLDNDHAHLAYALALSAADALFDHYGSDGIRNLMRNPDHLPSISAELDKALGLN